MTLTSATTPRAQLLLDRVGGAAQLLGRHALQRAGGEADLADLLEAVGGAATAANRELAAQLGRLALEPAALLDQGLEAGGQFGGGDLEALGQALQQVVLASGLVVGELAGHRLDPADAGGDGTLGDDAEQRDVAGAADMGAAAQLDRVGPAVLALAHRDDPDLVAVLLAEQRHGPGADRRRRGP